VSHRGFKGNAEKSGNSEKIGKESQEKFEKKLLQLQGQ